MSMDVSTNTSTNYFIPNSTGFTDSQTINRAGGTPPAVGAGTAAGVSAAPNAMPGVPMGVLMASLAPLMPRMSGEQLDVLVASFTEKAKDVQDASDKDQIKSQETAKRAAIKEKKANIENSIKKLAEAEDKMKHASIWDKIKLAFEYVGAILTILAGIATIAVSALTGVGVVAGAIGGGFMIASGICMLTMAVDSTVQIAQEDQGKGDLGMFGKMCKDIAKSRGMSDEDAEKVGQKGAMGASIALGALAAIFGLAGGVAGVASLFTSAGNMAMEGAELAEQGAEWGMRGAEIAQQGSEMIEQGSAMGEAGADMVEQGTAMAEQGAEMVERGAEMVAKGNGMVAKAAEAAEKSASVSGKVAKIVSGSIDLAGDANSAMGAGADVGSEVEHYQATNLQADAKQAQASSKRFEALQKVFDDAIDMALSHMKARGEAFNEVMDGVMEAINDRSQTLTNMQFRA